MNGQHQIHLVEVNETESFSSLHIKVILLFYSGFNFIDVAADRYGHHLHFWNWKEQTLLKSIDLGKINGSIPLELRFLHDPNIPCGYVVAALSGCVHRFYKDDEEWKSDVVISISAIEGILEGANPTPALITDMLISLDDRFLYLTCWYVSLIELEIRTIF